MPGIDQFDQPRAVDVGIDLRRRNIGVAKQRLEHAKVGPAGKQMRRKGVAQDVRTDPLGRDPGKPGTRWRGVVR